jgi:hypothetical protein
MNFLADLLKISDQAAESKNSLDEGIDISSMLDVLEKLNAVQLRALLAKLVSSKNDPDLISAIKQLARS